MVNLHKNRCTVKDPENRLLAEVCEKGNTYPAHFSIVQPPTQLPMIQTVSDPTDERLDDAVMSLTEKTDNDVMRWHQRLGHLNVADIWNLARKHATGMEIVEDNISNADCLACIHGKQHKLPFKIGWTHANHISELIHMDLAGPMETTSFDGKKYFLIIVDDYSWAVWVEPLTLKSETVSKIKDYSQQFETGYGAKDYSQQFETGYGAKIHGIMANNGTEFVNNEMNRY